MLEKISNIVILLGVLVLLVAVIILIFRYTQISEKLGDISYFMIFIGFAAKTFTLYKKRIK